MYSRLRFVFKRLKHCPDGLYFIANWTSTIGHKTRNVCRVDMAVLIERCVTYDHLSCITEYTLNFGCLLWISRNRIMCIVQFMGICTENRNIF